MSRPAHRLAAKPRTSDVTVSEDVTFAGLLLSEPVLLGLKRAGFERPSPIQLRAIPLGRCAVDLIVQAKSGTGKTCVLAVLALEALVSAPPSGRCRALVLAPTREVAVQVAQVITAIGAEVPGLAVHTLIGGLPLAQDVANLRRCNIAVGTPGRVRQLVDCEALNTDSVRLFVMDEADKLMEDAFVDDINFIYSTLPASKQMIALSATYPESLANLLARYMRSPTFVRLGKSSAALLGIRQYVLTVPHEPLVTKQLKLKLDALVNILSTVSFTQCLVFSNHQTRAETLCSQLSARGWPSAHLSSSLSQERRLEALSQLTSLRCRVLVTTDLGARGVDSEHADLVVQLDVPWDGATYLHRVGRAGRYGSLGAAVALVSVGEEEQRLATVVNAAGVSPLRLPDTLPADLKTCPTDSWRPFAAARSGRRANGGSAEDGERESGGVVRTEGGGGGAGKSGGPESNGHRAAAIAGNAAVKTNGSRACRTSAEDGDASKGGGEGTNGGGALEGRKIRTARRRKAPGPSTAEQRQDNARLEAASDGWARAVATRGRRQTAAPAPAPAAEETPPPTLDWDRPGVDGKDGSETTGAAPAVSAAGDDSDGSQDSFKALLEAYKRDQQRQASQYSSGGEKASSEGGQKAEASVAAGQKSEVSATDDPNAETSANGSQKAQKSSGAVTSNPHIQNGSAPKYPNGNSAVVGDKVAVEEDVDAIPDAGSDQMSDGDSDVEAGAIDEDRLREVLKKLNPREVGSLTEDDLRMLVLYLKIRRGTDCRMYRRAVALVRKRGVYQVLLQSRGTTEIDASLKGMMERLSVEPEAPTASSTSGSAADSVPSAAASDKVSNPSPKADVRPSSLAKKQVAKSSVAGVSSMDVSPGDGETVVLNAGADATFTASNASVNMSVTGQTVRSDRVNGSAATYTAPAMKGSAICSSSAAVCAAANYDEEVRQIESREEDVEAFQRDLRLNTARSKALEASRRIAAQSKTARVRTTPAAAVTDSSSSEDTSDESDSEEATITLGGGRDDGRQWRSVQPRRAQAGLGAHSSWVKRTSNLPAFGAAVDGESHAPRAGSAISNEDPTGSSAGYQSHYQYEYLNQQHATPWNQQYPGSSSEYHDSYYHQHPTSWTGYDTSAFSGYPDMYSSTPAWSPSPWGSWSQYRHAGHAGRTDGLSAHVRSWDQLLHMCFNQQSQYLAHMSRYYAQYHNLQQP